MNKEELKKSFEKSTQNLIDSLLGKDNGKDLSDLTLEAGEMFAEAALAGDQETLEIVKQNLAILVERAEGRAGVIFREQMKNAFAFGIDVLKTAFLK